MLFLQGLAQLVYFQERQVKNQTDPEEEENIFIPTTPSTNSTPSKRCSSSASLPLMFANRNQSLGPNLLHHFFLKSCV
jgi:hypothetical protein